MNLKYTPYKIILDVVPHRRFKMCGGDSKENIDKTNNRQLEGQSSSIPFMSMTDSYV